MTATAEPLSPAFVDIRGAARILSVSEPTVRRLAARGELRKVNIGPSCVRYRVEELRRFGETQYEDLSFLD